MSDNLDQVLFEVVLNGVRIAPPQTSDVEIEYFLDDKYKSFYRNIIENQIKNVIPEYTNEQLIIALSKVEVESFSVEVGAAASYLINLTVFDPSMAAIDFIVSGVPLSEQSIEVVIGWVNSDERLVARGSLLTGIEPSIRAGGASYNLTYIMNFNDRLTGLSKSSEPLYKIYDTGRFKLLSPAVDSAAWKGYETMVWSKLGTGTVYAGRHVLFQDMKFKTGFAWSLIEELNVVMSNGLRFNSEVYAESAPSYEKALDYYTVKVNDKVVRLFKKDFIKLCSEYTQSKSDGTFLSTSDRAELKDKIYRMYSTASPIYPDTKLNSEYEVWLSDSKYSGVRIASQPVRWTERSAVETTISELPVGSFNVMHIVMAIAGLNNIDVRVDPILLGSDRDDIDFSAVQSFISSKVMPLRYDSLRDIVESGFQSKMIKATTETNEALDVSKAGTIPDRVSSRLFPLGNCGNIETSTVGKGARASVTKRFNAVDSPRYGLYVASTEFGASYDSATRKKDIFRDPLFFRGVLLEKVEALWLYFIETEIGKRHSEGYAFNSNVRTSDIREILYWNATKKAPRYGNSGPNTSDPLKAGYICKNYQPYEGTLFSMYGAKYGTYVKIGGDEDRPRVNFNVGNPQSILRKPDERVEESLQRLVREFGYYYPKGLKNVDKEDPLKLYGFFSPDPATGNIVFHITGEVQKIVVDEKTDVYEFPRQTSSGRVLDFKIDSDSAFFLPFGSPVKDATKPVVNLNLGEERASTVKRLTGINNSGDVRDLYADWAVASAFYTAKERRGAFDIAIASQRLVDLHKRVALQATLVLVGSPNVKLMSDIQINVLRIDGTLHYLSGVYKIINIMHGFSGATYQTELVLIRGIEGNELKDPTLKKPEVMLRIPEDNTRVIGLK